MAFGTGGQKTGGSNAQALCGALALESNASKIMDFISAQFPLDIGLSRQNRRMKFLPVKARTVKVSKKVASKQFNALNIPPTPSLPKPLHLFLGLRFPSIPDTDIFSSESLTQFCSDTRHDGR
jgi:hypothetical protein